MASTEALRTALYLRISSDQRDGAGVERQEKECRERAERLGWEVTAVFKDNDISAFKNKSRPGYDALLDAIRCGQVQAVICWHSDRLHRQPKELETYIDLCNQRGVQNAAVQVGHIDLTTASGQMNARMLGAVAYFESQHKAERIRAAHRQIAEKGLWHGGIRCYAYEPDGMTIRESEAAEIRRIADAILAGQSLRSLAVELNQRGITTVKGNEWSSSHLRSVLLRPRLAGLRMHHDKIIGEAAWEPVLTRETWEAVKAVLEDPSRRSGGSGGRGRVPTTLGTGLYVCGICGQPRLRLGRSSARKPVYKCGGVGVNSLGHVSRVADKLDAYVEGALLGMLSQPGVIDALCDVVDLGDDKDLTALRAEQATIRPRLKKATQMWTAGVMDDEQFSDASMGLHARSQEIKAILAAANKTSPLEVLRDVDNIERAWDEILTMSQKRAILAECLTVTVLPATGRAPDGSYFDTQAVTFELTEVAERANCALTT